MGISTELTGTPWHVEKFTRAEGDEKRLIINRVKIMQNRIKVVIYCKQ